MQGKIKFFNKSKGWGYVKGDEGKEHFVHYSQIHMDGFKTLNEDDIVNFELGAGKDGREQAVNIQPILTMQMIRDSLKEENLYVQTMKDAYKVTKYLVVDANNVIQTSEQGMDFLELAKYAGFEIVRLSA